MTRPARGVRNNNPGNIRHGKSKWQGMAADQTDDEFVQFTSAEYGIRALCRLLLTYEKRGLDTVGEIIRTYAPPSENDSEKYVKDVCRWTGVLPDDVLDLDDAEVMLPLVKAIVRKETGATYPDSVFMSGLRLAGITGAAPKPLAQSRTIQGSAATIAGGAVAAAAEVSRQVQEVQQTVEPVLSFATWLTSYGVWVALAVVILAGCWVAWSRYSDRQRLGH